MLAKLTNDHANLFCYLTALLAAYFAFSLAGAGEFAGVFFELNAAAIVFYRVLKTRNFKDYWGFVALALALWVAGDAARLAFIIFYAGSPAYQNLAKILYVLTFVSLFICGAKITKRCLSGGGGLLQAAVDTFAIFLVFTGFFYVSLGEQSLTAYEKMVFVAIETALFCEIFIAGFTVRALWRKRSLFWLLAALLIFTARDLFYVLSEIKGQNTEQILRAILQICFFIFAFASLHLDEDKRINFSKTRNDFHVVLVGKILTLGALCAIMIYAADQTLNAPLLSLTLVLLLFYGVLTHNVSSVRNNEILIKKEQAIRRRLDDTVKRRVSELNLANARLKELGDSDYLTGALNRRRFSEILEEILKTKPLGENIGLYALDLRRFKAVNDTYGRRAGDDALAQIVGRLKSAFNGRAFVGRFGGDDIVVALRQATDDSAKQIASQILELVRRPVFSEEYRILLNAKIGVSVSETSEMAPQDLILQAETALNAAKKDAWADCAFFDEDMRRRLKEQNYIEILLNSADFGREFRLVFQPQYEISGKKLIGAEALLRWESRVKGAIPPSVFIPAAEQSPLIIAIGRWVCREAVKRISSWNNAYKTALKISINVSPKQLQTKDFAARLLEDVKNFAADARWVDAEITEMSWMSDEEAMQEALSEFGKHGVSVSIDDFGTGFSSLSYIKKYDVDRLKIAKELIDNIAVNDADRDVVKAVVALAKSINVRTIAEGVERGEQLEILRELGCDEVQGFLWGGPMSAAEFEELIKAQTARSLPAR